MKQVSPETHSYLCRAVSVKFANTMIQFIGEYGLKKNLKLALIVFLLRLPIMMTRCLLQKVPISLVTTSIMLQCVRKMFKSFLNGFVYIGIESGPVNLKNLSIFWCLSMALLLYAPIIMLCFLMLMVWMPTMRLAYLSFEKRLEKSGILETLR